MGNAVEPIDPTLMQLLDTVKDMRRAIQALEARLVALEAQADQRAQREKRWPQHSPARNHHRNSDV
jgi:prefoldin subunit 5